MKGAIMENVVTAIFEVESEAYKAFTELRQAPSGKDYKVVEAALLKRKGDTIEVVESIDAAGVSADDTARGIIIGSLAGILGGPLGVLLGANLGALVGTAFDTADTLDSASMLEVTAAKLYDGETAIVALVNEEEPAFDAAFEGFDVRIVRHFAIDVMDEVDRAIEEAAQDANLAKQEERAARKASVKKYFDGLKQKVLDKAAEHEAEREAYLDDLADKANEMTAKLAEADKAAGEAIKGMAADHEALGEAIDSAVDEASAAFVAETKKIYPAE
jgi:hypothetical protein